MSHFNDTVQKYHRSVVSENMLDALVLSNKTF